ncbi:MAG: glycine-rich domain-containing protein [Janthinobacterium lividum]
MHVESGEGWSALRADAVETEYRRFLYLMKKYPDAEASPTVDVDTFWHYHILDTMKYARDCETVFGYFLHHYPYVGIGAGADEGEQVRAGERMREIYEAEFGAGHGAEAAWCTAPGKEPDAGAWCTAPGKGVSGTAWCTSPGQRIDSTAWCTAPGKGVNGSAWCTAPGKRINGSAWCTAPGKRVDSTAWCTAPAKPVDAVAWCTAPGKSFAGVKAANAWCTAPAKPSAPTEGSSAADKELAQAA